MDPTLDRLWQQCLKLLSSFYDGTFDDGSVTFLRVQHKNDSSCAKVLENPLYIHGHQFTVVPLMFTITGRIQQEETVFATDPIACVTGAFMTRIKICLEQQEESISRIEWGQCAFALGWLGIRAMSELQHAVETERVWYKDAETQRLRINFHGLERFTPQVHAHNNGPVLPMPGYTLFDLTDRHITITDASQFPAADVPVRVTFSLEIKNTEGANPVMHAKITKLAVMATY